MTRSTKNRKTDGFRVGIDIGGTFTDAVMVRDDGVMEYAKVPSQPADFTAGLIDGLTGLNADLTQMRLLAHGTTVGINAIVSRRGAPTALITTKGFRDILLLRRTSRAEHFNLWWFMPPALLGRRDIFEVPERLDYRGDIVTPLDEEEARAVVRRIRRLGKTSVAIVFLHAFTNSAHEKRMKEIVREEAPDTYVCVSHEILPEILEYERASTTTLNAYLGPVLRDYVGKLRTELSAAGYTGEVAISTSAGGLITPERVQVVPALTVQSGPAAGVMAAAAIAGRAGFRKVITFDMGGTSTDIGLIVDGEVRRANEYMIEWQMPIRFPSIDIESIGAGGGSIAWLDSAAVLRNGPLSAGASPGPACYGIGGIEPTNTDAQVVLRRLDPTMFLGGDMVIHAGLAEKAINERVGRPLGYPTTVAAAADILRIAVNNILQSLRTATIYRGHDPRDFVLFAYGGAGPLFAADVALEGGIPKVVVPPRPGLTSASGLLMIDARHDLIRSILQPVTEVDHAQADVAFLDLEAQATEMLSGEGIALSDIRLEREADVRYYGTSHSMRVPVPQGPFDAERLAQLVETFAANHMREYGYVIPEDVAPVEIVNLRLVGVGLMPKAQPARPPSTGRGADAALKGQRSVYFDGFVETNVYDRLLLTPSARIDGPAIIEQSDTTTVVRPGMSAEVDAYGNIVIAVLGRT